MQATGHRVVVQAFSESPLEAIDKHMALEPMSAPDPTTLGPREVLVEVKSSSVGWVDLLMTSGQYQHLQKPPYCPGLEYAGVVAAKGSDVGDAIAVDDEILVDPFLVGPRSLGKYQAWGGFASYAVVPVAAALRIPGSLSLDQACNLLGNYETAYHCLVARGRIQPGETVLVHGASGATGLAAVQIAKLLGATVIATGRSKAKLAIVAAEGADHVLPSGDGDMKTRVKELTAGKGVDVVYDGVGGDVSAESLRCVKFGARFLVVGWAATPFVAREKSPNVLPTNLIMMKGVDVLGCPTVISTVNDPSIRPPRLARILEWAAAGKIRPHVSHTFPLTHFKDAMRAKWNGAVVGGCVVHP
jgi:NADPH2:quinone reductase